jgi:hypothetical protein
MTDIFEQAKLIGEQMDAEGNTAKGKLNAYVCTPSPLPSSIIKSGCGYSITTIDRDTGVTPMFVKCGHCGGVATSRMYRTTCTPEEATHEWFRPASELELPKGHTLESVKEHLLNGGLLLRPIKGKKDKWLKPTPAQKAFIKQEREMFERMRS